MFDNIGKKIKMVAKVITWIAIGLSVVAGVATFRSSIIVGILIMLVGSLLGWVGSFLLYGFGELIDTTSDMKQRLDEVETGIDTARQELIIIQKQISQKKPQKEYITIDSNGEQQKHCPKCGRGNIPTMTYCSSCGSKL